MNMPSLTDTPILLKVKGQHFGFWTRVSVRRSVDEFAHSFQLELTSDTASPFSPAIGDPFNLSIHHQDVMTGYIDTIDQSIDATSHSLAVSGRSKTADLVDCTLTEDALDGLTLGEIAEKLGKPFGLTVYQNAATRAPSEPLKSTAQSPFELLKDEAARQNVLLTCTPNGNFRIGHTSKRVLRGALELGVNVLSAQVKRDATPLFSKYLVKSENGAFGEADNSDIVKRHRPLEMIAQGDSASNSAEDKARHEKNRRNAAALSVTIKVQGWVNEQGELWDTDASIPVRLSALGVNQTLYIRAATFEFDPSSGTTTTLELTERAAYEGENA